MEDHHHDNDWHAVSARSFEVLEAGLDSLFDYKCPEKSHENDDTCERCELLFIESDVWNFMEFSVNLCFARLHCRLPPGFVRICCSKLFSHSQEAFFRHDPHPKRLRILLVH